MDRINILSLANNHAFDLQRDGIAATIGEVGKRGLAYAGTGADTDAAAGAGLLDTPKGKVALVAMATGVKSPNPRPGLRQAARGQLLRPVPDGRLNPEQRIGFSAACGRLPGI